MLKKSFIDLEKDDFFQYFTGFLCLIVYAGSLFFPLMDKDAAHHANIALHMYLHNDYASLVDRNTEYLDKPHFLFWVSLASFKIFGVNTFAHRFPALLFALISVYSTYKLTRHLSDKTTAKLAAIILATAQAFILSITDARMETPLTASIIFATWQLIVYTDRKKIISLLLAALGTAAAFSTKGLIGPVIIFITCFIRIALSRNWTIFLSLKTWLFVPLFFLFITPVLYAYYLQYDLHPEKVVHNMSHISGVKFILWQQNFERFSGFREGGRNSSYFFLYHTFLWAFFPWSVFAYAGVFYWLKRMFYYKKWNHPLNFAALSFAFILFAISFSRFKMPHYIIMLFPLAAILTAPYLKLILSYKKGVSFFYPLQLFFACLVFIANMVLNYYFFRPPTIFMMIAGPLLLTFLLLLMVKKTGNKGRKVLYVSVFVSIVFNFFLNYDFFPNLMKYQGGNELAALMKHKNISIPDDKIILVETNAHSFDFYRHYLHEIVEQDKFAAEYPLIKDKYFLLSTGNRNYLQSQGFEVRPEISYVDYNVATVQLKFLNPKTRLQNCDTLMLAKVYKR
jgi:4-amino-4-deoxy-L-arabinose transferase-like glycosyltransferase